MLTEKEKEVVKEMAEAFATAVQGEQQTLLRTARPIRKCRQVQRLAEEEMEVPEEERDPPDKGKKERQKDDKEEDQAWRNEPPLW